MNMKVLIVCGIMATLLVGCSGPRQTADSIDETLVEGPKAQLIRQIERKFTDPQPHYQLGKIYHAEGLYNRAEYEYNAALQFDPVHYGAQAAMVKLLMDTQQEQRARMAAEIYLNQAAAAAQASSLLGKAFQQEGLEEFALTAWQQALAQAPNSAVLHRQLGYYYLAKGDTVRAEEYLRRSIQLDPYQPEVAEQLGRMGVIVQVPRNPEKQSKSVDESFDRQEQ